MTHDVQQHHAASPQALDSDAPRTGAGVGRRAVATIVDLVVVTIGAVLWFSAFAEDGTCSGALSMNFTSGDDTSSVCGAPAGVFYLLGLGYYVVLEKLLGATLGKLLLGLRVERIEGGPISWGASLLRTVLRVVDGFFFYLVAAIAVWSSPRNQRLGDMAARSLVVRR